MSFAKWTFRLAGIWGLLITTPLYFYSPPALTHAEYFYAFIGVVIAWQIAFLMISSNPKQYHMLMLAAIVEKALGGGAFMVLPLLKRADAMVGVFGIIDVSIGIMFIFSFLKIRYDLRPGGN